MLLVIDVLQIDTEFKGLPSGNRQWHQRLNPEQSERHCFHLYIEDAYSQSILQI